MRCHWLIGTMLLAVSGLGVPDDSLWLPAAGLPTTAVSDDVPAVSGSPPLASVVSSIDAEGLASAPAAAGPASALDSPLGPGQPRRSTSDRSAACLPEARPACHRPRRPRRGARTRELGRPDPPVPPLAGSTYRVTPGDTLSEIAARTGLAVPAIVAANSLANPDLLTVGQQLVLPAAPRPAARPRPAPSQDRGPATLAAPAPTVLVWPVQGPITTFFGEVGPSSPRGHTGLDISAHWGMPVRAATSGRVLTAGDLGDGYGIQVLVQQSSHFQARYAHLSHLAVSVGDAVAQDQVIGLVGSTGFSTGAHLHFEVLVDGIPRDPLSYLP